jgi:hypothetical protein
MKELQVGWTLPWSSGRQKSLAHADVDLFGLTA